MKTAVEKAQELVDKFMPHSTGNSNSNEAIECALISVDETLEALNENQWQNRNQIAYYKEVELEIKKL